MPFNRPQAASYSMTHTGFGWVTANRLQAQAIIRGNLAEGEEAPNEFRCASFLRRVADGRAADDAVDFGQQIFAADVALQVDARDVRRCAGVQRVAHPGVVRRVAYVDLQNAVPVQLGPGVAHQPVPLVQQALDIAERFAELVGDLVLVVCLVPDHTGGARDQELPRTVQRQDGSPREQRAARAVLPRVPPGADLPRILDVQAGQGAGQEIHLQSRFLGHRSNRRRARPR